METDLQYDAQSCCSSLWRPAVCKVKFWCVLGPQKANISSISAEKAETCFEVIMWGA